MLRVPVFERFSDIVRDGDGLWFRHAAGASRFDGAGWRHLFHPMPVERETVAVAAGRLFVGRHSGLTEFAPDGAITSDGAPAHIVAAGGAVLWRVALGREIRVERRDLASGRTVRATLPKTLRHAQSAVPVGDDLLVGGSALVRGLAIVRVRPDGSHVADVYPDVPACRVVAAGGSLFALLHERLGPPGVPVAYLIDGAPAPLGLQRPTIETVEDVAAIPGGWCFSAVVANPSYQARRVLVTADAGFQRFRLRTLPQTGLAGLRLCGPLALLEGRSRSTLIAPRADAEPGVVERGRGDWLCATPDGEWIGAVSGLARRGQRVEFPGLDPPVASVLIVPGGVRVGGAPAASAVDDDGTVRRFPLSGEQFIAWLDGDTFVTTRGVFRGGARVVDFGRERTMGVPALHEGRLYLAARKSDVVPVSHIVVDGDQVRREETPGLPGFGVLGSSAHIGFYSTGADLYRVNRRAVAMLRGGRWRTVYRAFGPAPHIDSVLASPGRLRLTTARAIVTIEGDRVRSEPFHAIGFERVTDVAGPSAACGRRAMRIVEGERVPFEGELDGIALATDGRRVAAVRPGVLMIGPLPDETPPPTRWGVRVRPSAIPVAALCAGDGAIAVLTREGARIHTERETIELPGAGGAPRRLWSLPGGRWALLTDHGLFVAPGGHAAGGPDARFAAVTAEGERLWVASARGGGLVEVLPGVSERTDRSFALPNVASLIASDGEIVASSREAVLRRGVSLPWGLDRFYGRFYLNFAGPHLVAADGARVYGLFHLGWSSLLCADFEAGEVRELASWRQQTSWIVRGAPLPERWKAALARAGIDEVRPFQFAGRIGDELLFWTPNAFLALDLRAESWRPADVRNNVFRDATQIAVAPWGVAAASPRGVRVVENSGRVRDAARFAGTRHEGLIAVHAHEGRAVAVTTKWNERYAIDAFDGEAWEAVADGEPSASASWVEGGEILVRRMDGSVVAHGPRGARVVVAPDAQLAGSRLVVGGEGALAAFNSTPPGLLVRWPGRPVWQSLPWLGAALAFHDGRLWVWTGRALLRVTPDAQDTVVNLGGQGAPSALLRPAGRRFVATGAGVLWRLDPERGAADELARLNPYALATDGGWAFALAQGRLSGIEIETGRLVRGPALDGFARAHLAVDAARIWAVTPEAIAWMDRGRLTGESRAPPE